LRKARKEFWNSRVETSEEPRFRILQGRRRVYDFLLQTFKGAEKEISLITTRNDLERFSFFGIDDELMRLRREDVRVRVLTQVDQYGLELIKRYLDFAEVRHFSLPTSMRFIIVDESEVLNTFAMDDSRAPQEIRTVSTQEDYGRTFKAMMNSGKEEAIILESQIGRLPLTLEELLDGREILLNIPYLEAIGHAIWSNMKVYVDTMTQVFEDYWRESVPAKEILAKFSTQKVLIAGLELSEKSLKAAGWIVDVPGELVGKSGKSRSFSMVAKRADPPFGPLVLDLLTEEDALGPIVSLNAKARDLEPVLKLLASTRPLYKEEVRLADLYGIKPIYAIEAEELVANIVKEANHIFK